MIQVNDDEADAGLNKIQDCGDDGERSAGIDGDWAVVAETDDIADDVVARPKKGSLADDGDFQNWTGRPATPAS